ncbi:MAG TPA: hypothetical protein VFU89_00725 [Rhabdochlamydiaceae bacterium]|nr:hypothetical protein [Rhabdochlamydiaceae bacterium]
MIEICIVSGMNVYRCAAIGGLCAVIGGSIGGIVGVRSLYEIVFSEIMRAACNHALAGYPDQPYVVNPDLIPQGLLFKYIVIGAVIGALVGVVCAVAFNRLFGDKKESN